MQSIGKYQFWKFSITFKSFIPAPEGKKGTLPFPITQNSWFNQLDIKINYLSELHF